MQQINNGLCLQLLPVALFCKAIRGKMTWMIAKLVHSQESPDSVLVFSQASRTSIKVCQFLWGNVQARLCISAHDCHLPKVSNHCGSFSPLPLTTSHPSRWVIGRVCLEECHYSVTWLVHGETSAEILDSLRGQWQWLSWLQSAQDFTQRVETPGCWVMKQIMLSVHDTNVWSGSLLVPDDAMLGDLWSWLSYLE